jgi:hypothetical protein
MQPEERRVELDPVAKFELEQAVGLYKFYLDAYIKAIAFFLAIAGFVAKAAIDSARDRGLFSTIGLVCNAIVLIPIGFGIYHERTISRSFIRLAQQTGTSALSTSPFRMMIVATCAFWIVLSAGWFYLGGGLPN